MIGDVQLLASHVLRCPSASRKSMLDHVGSVSKNDVKQAVPVCDQQAALPP